MAARYPESTETILYIPCSQGLTIHDILHTTAEHFNVDGVWGYIIECENIQIDNFGYDLYDPIDWQMFFVIYNR